MAEQSSYCPNGSRVKKDGAEMRPYQKNNIKAAINALQSALDPGCGEDDYAVGKTIRDRRTAQVGTITRMRDTHAAIIWGDGSVKNVHPDILRHSGYYETVR